MNTQISEDIKENKIKNCYLLYGEEAYLKRQQKAKLLKHLIQDGDTMNFSSYQGKNIPVGEVLDMAETMPFLADYRVILMENSGFFAKSAPEELATYMAKVPETTCLLFVEDEVDKRNKLYKAVAKNGAAIEYGRENAATIEKWVLGRISKEKKKITRDDLQLFLSRVGNDMEFINNELEKLLSYTAEKEVIGKKEIEAIVTNPLTDNIFEMVNAFSQGQQEKAFQLYYELLEQKESPYRILYLIIRQFHQLLLVKDMREQGYDIRAIAEKTKQQEWLVRKNLNQAMQFSMDRLKEAVADGVQAEENFKKGILDERTAVELYLRKFSTK